MAGNCRRTGHGHCPGGYTSEADLTAPPIAGLLLAGGQSRRMGGGDKCLRLLAGRPILAHIIERARPQVRQLVLNANGDPARFAGFGLPVIADGVADFAGPLAGVLAGLDWAAARGIAFVVSLPTDAPFIPVNLVERLWSALEEQGAELACAASGGQHHPVVGLWPVLLREELRRAVADEGVRKVDIWTSQHRLAVVEFPVGAIDPFFNANRPEDLAEAERLMAKNGPGAGGAKIGTA
ncbi:MAG: molybdenum cofactor guanylyltransferase MobA [Dongiaceae bacterium]